MFVFVFLLNAAPTTKLDLIKYNVFISSVHHVCLCKIDSKQTCSTPVNVLSDPGHREDEVAGIKPPGVLCGPKTVGTIC